jgi:NAD(P)H-hydrate epimerase
MAFDPQAVLRRMLVTPAGMAGADKRAIEGGVSEKTLIARAADALFRVLRAEFTRRPVIVLAGPGNNGEDGLALAARLQEAEWPVTIIDALTEDPAARARPYGLERALRPSGIFEPGEQDLVIDALFGAGLSRAIEGEAAALVQKLNQSPAPVLAVDIPSGIDGATGISLGSSVVADMTVTFHRLKPGHLMGDGAELSGRLYLRDIGIEAQEADAEALHNDPSLWRHRLGPQDRDTHKYARGHCAVIGGPGLKGGAARLSARGAKVSGAGAVTFLTPLSAAEFAASRFDAVMVKPLSDPDELEEFLGERVSSVVIGPGMGHGHLSADCLTVVLESGLPCVLDADALTLYEDNPETLFEMLHEDCVLTPHEGEFARLFPDVEGDKLSRARAGAARAGATVLLKGTTTAIAGGGLPLLSTAGTAALATAGSGDVLAGLIGGLLAQGLGPCEAAAAGAWLHGAAGRQAGPGLHADALPDAITETLRALDKGVWSF